MARAQARCIIQLQLFQPWDPARKLLGSTNIVSRVHTIRLGITDPSHGEPVVFRHRSMQKPEPKLNFAYMVSEQLGSAALTVTHRSSHVCVRLTVGASAGSASTMADSDEDQHVELERPAKRQKTFTFQRFAQRVAQVRRSLVHIELTVPMSVFPNEKGSPFAVVTNTFVPTLPLLAHRSTLTYIVDLAMFGLSLCLAPPHSFR